MAERRMFAKTIIDSDAFLDMPVTSRLLYYDLGMRADDDGFVNSPKKIMKMVGASQDDIGILIARKFIIPFDNGVVVIKHWRIHNYIRQDTYNETQYKEQKELLEFDENKSYRLIQENPSTDRPRVVHGSSTQVSIGKDSIDKVSIGEDICAPPAEPTKQSALQMARREAELIEGGKKGGQKGGQKVENFPPEKDIEIKILEKEKEIKILEKDIEILPNGNIYASPAEPTKPSAPQKHKYGEYKNVLLTDEEYEKLQNEFPNDYEERIERLSAYIASKGAKYKNHLATIRNWARRDKQTEPKRAEANQGSFDTEEFFKAAAAKALGGDVGDLFD